MGIFHEKEIDSGTFGNAIRKVTPAGVVTTFVGTAGTMGYGTDGSMSRAHLYYPQGLVFDASGNLYVADLGSHSVRKLTKAGMALTVVGWGNTVGNVLGTVPGVLNNPVAVSVVGNKLFITETNGILQVSPLP